MAIEYITGMDHHQKNRGPKTGGPRYQLVSSAGIGSTVTTVKGSVDLMGALTGSDKAGVKAADKALNATGNLGGLVATSIYQGNLNAGQAGTVLTNALALTANPMEATRNPATVIEAARTVVGTYNLVRSVVHTLGTEGANALPPWLF